LAKYASPAIFNVFAGLCDTVVQVEHLKGFRKAIPASVALGQVGVFVASGKKDLTGKNVSSLN